MREITVLAFGPVGDVIGKSRFAIQGVSSTDGLRQRLEDEFPVLKNTPYAVAVNKQIVAASVALEDNDTVALLPPFSGG